MTYRKILLAVLLCLVTTGLSWAEEDPFEDVKILTQKITPNIYMIQGKGGNIGVSTGVDGVFLIDDQFAPLSERIRKAIRTFSQEPIRFVVNTHWHQDHTGGNESLGKTGTVIVAHENVRKRMSAEQFIQAFNKRVPPFPKDALPIITFMDRVKFHLNGDEIEVFHVDPAHTDGFDDFG